MVTSLPNQFSSKNGDKFHIMDVRNQQYQSKFQMESKPVHIRRANTEESKTIFNGETAFRDLQPANNAAEATTNSRIKPSVPYI